VASCFIFSSTAKLVSTLGIMGCNDSRPAEAAKSEEKALANSTAEKGEETATSGPTDANSAKAEMTGQTQVAPNLIPDDTTTDTKEGKTEESDTEDGSVTAQSTHVNNDEKLASLDEDLAWQRSLAELGVAVEKMSAEFAWQREVWHG